MFETQTRIQNGDLLHSSFREEKNEDYTHEDIPKAAFIYPLNSKTFNLEVWHFIITHLD